MTSKSGVSACELVRERGENVLELPPVEIISRTKEAGTENAYLGGTAGERLGDGRLSGSCQSIEPENVSVLWVFGPSHDPIEDGLSSPAKAGVMMTSFVSCAVHRIQLSKQLVVRSFLVIISVSHYPSASLKSASR